MRSTLPSLNPEIDPRQLSRRAMRQLVPFVVIRDELGVSSMSIHRWLNDPALGFPRPVLIRNRRYFFRDQIERFKDRMIEVSGEKGAAPANPLPRRPAKRRVSGGLVSG
jgi:hypothetical protein